MKFLLPFLFLSSFLLPYSPAQTPVSPGITRLPELEEARQLAVAGRHAEAGKMYQQLLSQDRDNIDVLLAAAYNYSWSGQREQAKKAFDLVLARAPNRPEALIGKGYNLAWAGEYAAAKTPFLILEKLQPDSWEAKKGLAYVYLWQGNSPVAIRYFEELILTFPKEIEYYIALAQAYLQNEQVRLARIALNSGLALDPDYPVALQLLNNTHQQAALLDLDILTGYSVVEGLGSFGLRSLQASGRVHKSLRLFARYDNSLSLDLSSLLRQNQEAQAFSAGGVYRWNSRATTRLDYGMRFLPENVKQQIVSAEQVIFLPNNMALKAGGFMGLGRQVDREWMAYLGLRVPVSRFYAIEPYYFYARVENSPLPESRILLNNQFRLSHGYEINLGFLYGKTAVQTENGGGAVRGAYCSAVLPFSSYVWGLLSLRHEKGPFQTLSVLSAGLKLRLER